MTLFAVLAAILLMAPEAHAEWPMPRGDALRTGVAPDGVSNIVQPAPYWRRYMGGSLASHNVRVVDVDGDGTNELAYASGGRIVVKDAVGNAVWESRPLGLNRLVGAWDFDGDSDLEILVAARGGAFLLDAQTGAVVWTEPPEEMGTLSGIRVADLTDDGLPDVLLQECMCCGVGSGNPGFVYSFAGGTPTLEWELPFASCGGARSTAILDADGDGTLEVLVGRPTVWGVLDGETGAVLAEVTVPQNRSAFSYCWPTQTDADASEEVLCILSTPLQSTDNHRTLFRLSYEDDGTTQTLTRDFEVVLGPNDIDVHYLDPVADLDEDGTAEVVISTKEGADAWVTRVFEHDGTVADTLTGHRIFGHAPIGAGGAEVLLTWDDADAVHGWSFDGGLTELWTHTGHSRLSTPDDRRFRLSDSKRLIHTDFDGDGVDDLVMSRSTSGPGVSVWNFSSGSPALLHEFDYPGRFEAVNHLLLPPFNRGYPQIAVVRDDGYLSVFDDNLSPIFIGADGGIPGIRVGGYYAPGNWRDLRRGPITGDVGDGFDAVFVPDSRGYLVRLDAPDTSSSMTPEKVWERNGIAGTALIDGLDSTASAGTDRALASVNRTSVIAMTTDNVELWRHDVGTNVVTLNDVVPGTFEMDDPVPDLVFQWGETSNTRQQIRALDGADGTALWDAAEFESGAGRQPAGLTVDSFDGDAIDDVFYVGPGLHVLDGASGTEIGALAHSASYGMLSRVDIDEDSARETVFHGSNGRLMVAESDLSVQLWSDPEDARAYPYGAVVECPGERHVLVSESWEFASRVKIIDLEAGTLGTASTTVLASGQAYADEAAADAAGAFHGQLSSVTVHPNLRGDGRPVALFGSVDGHLYGLDPCDSTLLFAVDFGVAVGISVFADTDGDGRDEILTSVADGYLYDLRNVPLEPPAWVHDRDPADPANTDDIDDLEGLDALTFAWAAVPNAVSYEIAVFDETDSTELQGWTETTDRELALTGQSLVDGHRYYAVVRAVADTGDYTLDAVSDGVTVRMATGTDVSDVGGDVAEATDTAIGGDTGVGGDADVAADTATGGDTAAPGDDAGSDTGATVDMMGDAGPGDGGGSDDSCCTTVRRERSGERNTPWFLLGLLGLVALARRRAERPEA